MNPNHVNMATNRLAKMPQDEVRINGATYFASGAGMAMNMTQNQTLRFSKDPMTNRSIDKSGAVTYADASGRVFYF